MANNEDAIDLMREVERLKKELAELQALEMSHEGACVRLKAERDEAREWVERLTKEQRTLTCVYCGHEYPPGSPSHGANVLTEHIKVCEKHPMREVLDALRDLVEKAGWCVDFIQTREKMHVAGQAMFLASLERASAALKRAQ